MKLTVLATFGKVVAEYPRIGLAIDEAGLVAKCYTELEPGSSNVEELRVAPGTWISYKFVDLCPTVEATVTGYPS